VESEPKTLSTKRNQRKNRCWRSGRASTAEQLASTENKVTNTSGNPKLQQSSSAGRKNPTCAWTGEATRAHKTRTAVTESFEPEKQIGRHQNEPERMNLRRTHICNKNKNHITKCKNYFFITLQQDYNRFTDVTVLPRSFNY
jgi:hypothetical protein